MKRCIRLPAATRGPVRRPARHLVCALGAVYLALATAGCATDDPLPSDVANDCDDCEPSNTSGGGSGGSPGNGESGENGSGESGSGGASTQPDDEDTEDSADDPELDGGAPGETGIFVGMTAAHNAARAQLGLDEALPDLQWSTELAEVAQDWSDNLATTECGTIEHRMPNSYGENIAMRGSTRLTQPFSPEEAVDGWNAEVACWDYGTINGTERCDAQCAADLNSNGCGHYTQLVWRNTRRVGCGYSTCQGGQFTYEIWVCNYDPPGNYIGQTPY